MNKLHHAAKSLNVLNGLLTLAVAVTLYHTAIPYLSGKVETTLPAVGKTEAERVAQQAAPPIPSLADYVMISNQNLFHPERKIPPEKKDEKTVSKPDLVLYGTLITDNLSIAYIEDKKSPYSTPGRGKRQTQLKKGDAINGYILREIEPNRIVLLKGEEKLVIMLEERVGRGGAETAKPAAAAPLPANIPPRPYMPVFPPPVPITPRYPTAPMPTAPTYPSPSKAR